MSKENYSPKIPIRVAESPYSLLTPAERRLADRQIEEIANRIRLSDSTPFRLLPD